jgi:hypothetical protein
MVVTIDFSYGFQMETIWMGHTFSPTSSKVINLIAIVVGEMV